MLKFKENGFRWFVWRLRRELRSPSIPFNQKWINKLLHIRKKISKVWRKPIEEDILYAIYDMDVCGITYNMAEFLVNAEYESTKKNKEGFVVVFVPSSNDPNLIWTDYDSAIDFTRRQWRFQNIVIPLTALSKKCRGTIFLPHRSDAVTFVSERDVYPDFYDGVNLRSLDIKEFYGKLNRPNLFDGLSASEQGLRYIQEWISKNTIKDPIVTISIRECEFDKARNSNIDAWAEFAVYLRSKGYHPVVIPDTDAAFDKDPRFDGMIVFRECAWNLGLRISLHESAFLNFFVDHGCLSLAQWNPRCSYIAMNHLPEGSLVTTKESWEFLDHPIGSSYKFATSNQKLCFNPDTFENIVDEFEQFLREQKPQETNETSSSSTNQQIPG